MLFGGWTTHLEVLWNFKVRTVQPSRALRLGIPSNHELLWLKSTVSQKEQIHPLQCTLILLTLRLEMKNYYVWGTLRDFLPNVCKVLQIGCREWFIAIAIQAVNRSRRRKYSVPNHIIVFIHLYSSSSEATRKTSANVVSPAHILSTTSSKSNFIPRFLRA